MDRWWRDRVEKSLDRLHELGFEDAHYDAPGARFLVPSRGRFISLEATESMTDELIVWCLETDD